MTGGELCDALQTAIATREAEIAELQAEVERERAAREQAEKDAEEWRDCSRDWRTRAETAEEERRTLRGERDTALARVKELVRSRYKGCGSYPRAIGEIESCLGIVGNPPLGEVVEAVRKLVTDIATERAAREQAEAQFEACRKDREAAVGRKGRLQQAERERDTALARVKELERSKSQGWHEMHSRALAAESALASARELLSEARETMTDEEEPLRSNMDAWLSPAPSPAPCSGCAAARELLQDIADMHWGETLDARRDAVAAWLKGHGK